MIIKNYGAMNYEKLHDSMIRYCKETTPRDRMKARCSTDYRLSLDSIYTESHHIIPKSLGGSDDASNMVELLPEEHYLIHLIRYKAYSKRADFLAVRFIANGYESKAHLSKELTNSKPFNKKIGLHKQFIASFRKSIGWHTDEGIKAISEARKGTMPGIVVNTGERVCVSVDDPRVINGEIRHHTTGMSTYYTDDGLKVYMSTSEAKRLGFKSASLVEGLSKGSNNSRYKPVTDQIMQSIFYAIENSLEDSIYVKANIFHSIIKERENLSSMWIKTILLTWVTLLKYTMIVIHLI